jgi:hypothetical protein
MPARRTKTPDRPPATRPPPDDSPAPAEPRRAVRVAVLLVGLLLPQVVLLGSSLWGGTILLPLDVLAQGTTYVPPATPGAEPPPPKDPLQSDLVFQAEVYRRLVVDEVRAGRLPLWNPYNYCGHPLLAANQPGAFSPYRLLDYLWPSPVALAWGAVLRAVVAGTGMYLLARRAMGVGWLAAAGGAWAFPLTGTLVLSGGYPGAAVVSFLPWVLLAAEAAARRPSGRSVAALAAAVAATLLAGHAAFAGQVLVVATVYLAARVFMGWAGGPAPGADGGTSRRRRLAGAVAGVVGLAGGMLVSAPQTLPTVEYLRSSNRIAERASGAEEKPAGAAALVQLVLPYAYGSTQWGSAYVGPGESNRIESAAGGYAGLLAVVVLVPLAFADPRRRRWAGFLAAVVGMAVVPTVGVPVLDLPFRLPPLSLLRNNRLVFAAAFGLVALATLGLDALARRPAAVRSRAGRAALAAGLLLAVGLAGWSGARAAGGLVGPDGQDLHPALARQAADDPAADAAAAAAAANPAVLLWPDAWAPAVGYDAAWWFGLMYSNGLLLSAAAGVGVLVVLWATSRDAAAGRVAAGRRLALPAIVVAAVVAEMTAAAAGVNVRGDPSLYYPRLRWMDAVAARGDGRVCGVFALQPNVLASHRLADLRGYDAADPQPTVDLVRLARDRRVPDVSPPFAVTLLMTVDPFRPGPVADLLGVRYLVGRGPPPPGLAVVWAGDDYWVAENARALPRATVPRSVRVLADRAERLAALGAADHDPAAEAVLEAPGPAAGEGTARIVGELPGRVRIEVDMARGGLVRLADAWDAGWRATYDGRPIAVVRVDHALRGVEVPAGRGVVEFSYEPASFRWGLILAAVAAGGLVVLTVVWRANPR